MSNQSLILPVFLWLLASLALASGAESNDTLPKGILALDGRPAPPLKLLSLDEESFDLAQHRGHWVMVHFWAAWCGPCRREMPKIQAIIPRFEPTKLKIVLVNTAESEDTVFSFLGSVAPDLGTLMDTDGLVTERWQPRGLPASFFVDPQGNLRYLALGGRAWQDKAYLGFLQQLVRAGKGN